MEPRFELVAIGQVHPSPVNIRRHIDPVALKDLTASVREKGILTPLLVRPNSDGFELAAGHRRLEAALQADLSKVPILIRPMDDAEFMEILITENLQRQDVHPMDESLGYQAMQKADARYTPEAIAAKVGKSVSYVYRRLKLLNLIPTARKAFEENVITAAHAERLARLPTTLQKDALEECFVFDMFTRTADGEDDRREPAPLSRLDTWIAKHFKTEPAAPDTPHYFPEFADDLDAEGETLLQLSESHTPGADLETQKHGVLGAARWDEIRTKKDECPHVRRGVVVHGGPMRIVRVCAQKGCTKHRPPQKRAVSSSSSSASTSPAAAAKHDQKAAAERRRRELEEARRETVQRRAMDEALDTVSEAEPHVLRLAIADALRGDVDSHEFSRRFGIKVHMWRVDLKDLKKLPDATLPKALAFCVLSAALGNADHVVADTFKQFSVDVKRIDKEVAAEQAAQERLAGNDDVVDETPAKVRGKKAAKKR